MPDPEVLGDKPPPEDLSALARRAQDLNHDLRTPIGTMATALELLRAGGTRFCDDDLETLEVLQRQVAKLTTLAESLRSFAAELEAKCPNASTPRGPVRPV